MRITVSGPGGSGKTYLTVLLAVDEARRGNRVLWEGASDGLANDAIADCSDVARQLGLQFVDPPDIGRRELIFTTGGTIVFINGSAPHIPEREQRYDIHIGDEVRFSGNADRQILTRMTL